MPEKEPVMAKKTAKRKAPKATKPQPTSKTEPPSLVPGTVLRKLDRKGKTRCECTVEAEGYRYKGTVYGSLSGAAAAAAKDVGLSGTSFNGYVFWGLTRPGFRARGWRQPRCCRGGNAANARRARHRSRPGGGRLGGCDQRRLLRGSAGPRGRGEPRRYLARPAPR